MSLPSFLRSGNDGILAKEIERLDKRIDALGAGGGGSGTPIVVLSPTDPDGTDPGTIYFRRSQ